MSPARLRTLRARYGVTQRELARGIGLWPARISDLETGRGKMLQREAEAIERYFKDRQLGRKVNGNGHE